MTDVMERAGAVIGPAPDCTADRHGATDHAWTEYGCRCPAAVKAHEVRLAKRRGSTRKQDAKVDEHGNCIAEKHGPSERAWLHGCRCPGSVAAREAVLAADRVRYRERKPMPDPTLPWRGPDEKVSPIGLQLLLGGIVTSPTHGEKLAAVYRLARTPNRWGTGINSNSEIATRLQMGEKTVRAHKETLRVRRRDRAHRRLADVRWKEYRRQQAIAAGRGHDRSGHKAAR